MQKYDVIRFKQNARNQVIWRGITREQAMEWCESELTHGKTWFDGFTQTGTHETTKKPKYQLPYKSPEKL